MFMSLKKMVEQAKEKKYWFNCLIIKNQSPMYVVDFFIGQK